MSDAKLNNMFNNLPASMHKIYYEKLGMKYRPGQSRSARTTRLVAKIKGRY